MKLAGRKFPSLKQAMVEFAAENLPDLNQEDCMEQCCYWHCVQSHCGLDTYNCLCSPHDSSYGWYKTPYGDLIVKFEHDFVVFFKDSDYPDFTIKNDVLNYNPDNTNTCEDVIGILAHFSNLEISENTSGDIAWWLTSDHAACLRRDAAILELAPQFTELYFKHGIAIDQQQPKRLAARKEIS